MLFAFLYFIVVCIIEFVIINFYFRWVPYTKAPNKCELNCMPKGERFYFRHKRKVIDGTRCDEEKLDICVDGHCMVSTSLKKRNLIARTTFFKILISRPTFTYKF